MRPRSAAPDIPGKVRTIRRPKVRTDSMLFMITALLFKNLSAEVTFRPIGVTGYVRTMTLAIGVPRENSPNSKNTTLRTASRATYIGQQTTVSEYRDAVAASDRRWRARRADPGF